MTHRDDLWDRPGGLPTPADGSHGQPDRRLAKAMGRRRARLPMRRIAQGRPGPHAPSRKPWQTVPMSHYYRSLVLVTLSSGAGRAGPAMTAP